METKSLNRYLHKASQAKFDEFYTQLSDIERELSHYKEHFKTRLFFVIAMTRELAVFSIIFHTTLNF